MADLSRIDTVNTSRGDVELGVTDAIQKHYSRHVIQRKAVSRRKLDFEAKRPRWVRECAAEIGGVFFYGMDFFVIVVKFSTDS